MCAAGDGGCRAEQHTVWDHSRIVCGDAVDHAGRRARGLDDVVDFAHEDNVEAKTFNDVRTILVNLPAGFDANSTAVPTCTPTQLLAVRANGTVNTNQCPVASQVGQISFEVGRLPGTGTGKPPEQVTVPLYNMEVTSFGVTAELGFKISYLTQVLLVSVRPGDSGLTVTTPNITKVEPRNMSVTVWGLPASHEHDCSAWGGLRIDQDRKAVPACYDPHL